uniref:Uncharacterized protein n=1 Tax=Helianthus annuus TaxID=4232 RepID=A0A251VB03_HELAN
MVIKSHLEIKLGINRINWISGILHGLVHRDKLNIMIRVESRRKDGIRILYVIMVKRKAGNRCSRGCLVRIRESGTGECAGESSAGASAIIRRSPAGSRAASRISSSIGSSSNRSISTSASASRSKSYAG